MENVGKLELMDRRGRELRYLTEHYRDLQGLVMAPAWVAVMLAMAWASAINGLTGFRLWLMWLIPIALGPVAVKCALWARDWYERLYGIVWNADDDEPVAMISLLHSGDPEVVMRRRRRLRQRVLVALLVLLIFMLPGLWLHGLQRPGWAGFGYLFAMPTMFYLGPVILEPVGGSLLVMWRRAVYAAAALALLSWDLMYLDGRLTDNSAMAMVGGVMLLVSLQDHWLFTRLLRGGAKVRGGCDE